MENCPRWIRRIRPASTVRKPYRNYPPSKNVDIAKVVDPNSLEQDGLAGHNGTSGQTEGRLAGETTLPYLTFRQRDFEVFSVEGFSARMELIYRHIRPRLVKLGDDLAPELSRRLHMEFFPHVAKHARRTVNPPAETWAAFGPSPKGYKRYGYLALCISRAGLHARAVVKTEADHRDEIGAKLRAKASDLAKSFRGTKIAHYEKWDLAHLPATTTADPPFFELIADAFTKKTSVLDVGFGWRVHDALRLERAELLDAFAELEPLYRVLRSVS